MAKKKKNKVDLNVHAVRKRRQKVYKIIIGIFLAITLYFALIIGSAMYQKNSTNFFEGIFYLAEVAQKDNSVWIPTSLSIHTLISCGWSILIWAIASALLWYEDMRHRHDMSGIEKGSAKLNDDYSGFNNDFSETDKSKTTYLSRNVALSMDTRKTLRNNNVLIIGGSGAGKTRFFVKPNILQLNCNMVITDPSGELLESTGTYLEEEGYAVKIFNLVEMSKSHCYNPFHYIRDDQGVIMMINCLIKNTTPPESSSSDPFWEKSETALLQALCFYLKDHRPVEEQNFATVMELLRWAEVDERNPDYESKLDRVFLKSKQKNKRPPSMFGAAQNMATDDDEGFNKYMAQTVYHDSKGNVQKNYAHKSLEELDVDGTDIAVKQYKIFKMGAGKTAKSILISCAVRLTVFNLPQLARLTNVDNIHLEDLGGTNPNQRKQALFVIIPAADSTFNFLVSMMYSQLFETLYFTAETSAECNKKRLPRHVKFLLDEFANIGTIPEFTKKLATMRKYEISCSVILQNLAQIKTMYKDDWESIIGNCDSMVFLGGKEYTTLEYLSKELGNQTIINHNRNMSQGKQSSASQGYQTDQRAVMTPDELGNMDNSMCVVQIRGLDPFLDNKFDYLAHPNYEHTSDADPSLSYQNLIDNMRETTVSPADVMAYRGSQAEVVYKICTLEDMIKDNPAWNDYPGIFSQFKSVEPADDTETAIKELAAAVKHNPPLENSLDESEGKDEDGPETSYTLNPNKSSEPVTIADCIVAHINGEDAAILAKKIQSQQNFFADEDED